jgi:hypothetical protein
MSIEDRLKALEDWQQALARVFLAPPQPVKSPAALANENTSKESLVCACGQPKKAGYATCYKCWEKKVAK